MKRVYIILVNWNGWQDTIECLESVFRCDYPNFRVVVCDNGSTDDSLARLRGWAEGRMSIPLPADISMDRYFCPSLPKPLDYVEYQLKEAEAGGDRLADPPLTIISAGANLGFAGGNNVAILYALARADFAHVWLLNNDTVIDPHALTAMVQRMEHKSNAGMCGSVIRYYNQPEKIQALGGGWHCSWIGLPWHYGKYFSPKLPLTADEIEKRMNYVEGCSLLASRSFIETVGLMSEDYFLYFEETDWAVRGKGRFSLACAPESIIYHKVGGSIGTSSKPWQKSLLCDYYNVRNRLLFTRRYYFYALPTVYLAIVATLIARAMLGKWERVKMIIGLLAGNYAVPQDLVIRLNQSDRHWRHNAQQ